MNHEKQLDKEEAKNMVKSLLIVGLIFLIIVIITGYYTNCYENCYYSHVDQVCYYEPSVGQYCLDQCGIHDQTLYQILDGLLGFSIFGAIMSFTIAFLTLWRIPW